MAQTDMPPNVEELLDGIIFPVSKGEILVYAGEHGAGEEAMTLLQALPVRDYRNMQEINAGLGLIEREPGSENLWSSAKSKEEAPDTWLE